MTSKRKMNTVINSKQFSAAEKFILNKLVEEVPGDLYYHGVHHTLDVLDAALNIADTEKLTDKQLKLLRIAVLYHDAGFIKYYKNHEQFGCELAKENLPKFGFNEEEIKLICNLIMATTIPQKPSSKLEKIICDADLDYLGRNDFEKIARSLFDELKRYSFVTDENEWDEIQKKFLANHSYHTKFSIETRDPVKQKHLKNLKAKKD